MYFRLLVPERSQLESGSDSNLEGEAGRAMINDYLEVPPGSTSRRFSWVSPDAAAVDEEGGLYRLTIQKQPGLLRGPITLAIHVPDGFRITDASEGLTVSGGTASLEATFAQDISVALRYGP